MRAVVSLTLLSALAVSAVSAVSAQPMTTVSVSGSVVWSGLGPVPNVNLKWTVKDLIFPIYYTTLKTNSNGLFSGSVKVSLTHFYGQELQGRITIPGDTRDVHLSLTATLWQVRHDFTIPPPTVLINGAFQPPTLWNSMLARLPGNNHFQSNQITTVSAHGRVVTLPDAWRSGHVDNARRLAGEIDKYRADILQGTQIPSRPMTLHLVAHSLDGLVARAYIANHTGGSNQNRVDKCVTIGSPHLGTWWLESLPPSWPPFQYSPALFQTRPSWLLSVFPTQLKGTYGTTRFYLAGASRNRSPFEPEAIPGWPFDRNDDGVVSAYSATFPFWGAQVAGTAYFPHAHYDMPGQLDVIKQVANWLK